MIVAVTGASGHIGSNLCRRLADEGHVVRAQYRTYRKSLEGVPVRASRGDVSDPVFVRKLVSGVDAVFHLAAEISISGDPDGQVWKTNVEGAREVVDACMASKVGRLVHFSSIHAFRQAPRDERLDEDRPLVGADGFAYDRSKAQGERIVREGCRNGLDAVILNPTAVVGPVDFRPSRMGGVLLALAKGRMPLLVDGGFDWVDVRDVADAALAALSAGKPGQSYLLSGRWASLSRIAQMVDKVRRRRSMRVAIPVRAARAAVPLVRFAAALAGSPPVFTRESLEIVSEGNRQVDSHRARAELGFTARPLEDTIRDTIKWFEMI